MGTKRRRTVTHLLGQIGFWLLIVVIFFYLIFPFYWAVNSALKTQAELIQTPATYFPENPTLVNFRAVFQNDAFLRGLGNSVLVAGAVTLMSLLVGLFIGPQGYVLAAAIAGVMVLGVAWPWVAMRAVRCEMTFPQRRAREGDVVRVLVRVRNRFPWPVWGLSIERGFFVDPDATGAAVPALALARVIGARAMRFFRVRSAISYEVKSCLVAMVSPIASPLPAARARARRGRAGQENDCGDDAIPEVWHPSGLHGGA